MPFRNNRAGWLALATATLLAGCATTDPPRLAAGRGRPVSDTAVKLGAPYRAGGRIWVPADDRAYDVVGLASWYGAAHRGLPTANGERFDPAGISAAHTTLPLPSYVEVTALATGRTIVLRINDRGPFLGGRVIDLSQGAAQRLGVEQQGVARVRVRRVFPGEADRAALRAGRPASARPTASRQELALLDGRFGVGGGMPRPNPPPLAGGRVIAPRTIPTSPPTVSDRAIAAAERAFLDMGGFDDADRADAFASAAGGIGPATVIGIGALWHVRIGPFADDATARTALARANAAGYQDARIVRENEPAQEDR